MAKRLIPFETIAQEHPCFLDAEEHPDWPRRFGNAAPLKLEIGFGNGNFLIDMAIRQPQCNFVGMDFYHKGIRKTIMRMDRLRLRNIQIAYGDAKERIPYLFRDGELSEIFINFPDPWPKKRHYKRRLIKPPFVELLARKLAPEGSLRVATDFESYAEEILEFLNGEPGLSNLELAQGFSPCREDTPRTKYEKNFINAGKNIFYLDFIKKAECPGSVPAAAALAT